MPFASEPDIAGVVNRDEVDSVEREGVTTSERDRLMALEREVKAPAVGFGFHVRFDVGGQALCGVRDQRVRPTHRRLAC